MPRKATPEPEIEDTTNTAFEKALEEKGSRQAGTWKTLCEDIVKNNRVVHLKGLSKGRMAGLSKRVESYGCEAVFKWTKGEAWIRPKQETA